MVKTFASCSAVFFVALIVAGAARAAEEIPDGRLPPPAAPVDAFYRSVAVVTGTRIETRGLGFAQCLGDVLVQVTGDQTILKEPSLQRAAADAQSYVTRFSYHDRRFGFPVHDEQGTYDRPHNLTVDFDRAKIDVLVGELGRTLWPLPRPRIAVLVAVKNVKNSFVLSRDGTIDRSADMREAFAAAAVKAALPPVVFPTEAEIGAHGWTQKTIDSVKPAEALAHANGADVAVVGSIVFSEKALGWIVTWRTEHTGKVYAWGTRGVNFDAAFRNALFGTEQILSGHGKPGPE